MYYLFLKLLLINIGSYCISVDCIYFFPLLLFGLCLVNAYVNLQNIDFSIVCMCVHLCECRDVLYKFFINILLLLFSCVLLKTKFSIANNVIETKKCKKCSWNNLDMNEIASILSYHWFEWFFDIFMISIRKDYIRYD